MTGDADGSGPGYRGRTLAEACRAVLDDPEGDHSLYGTLAPLYDRMMAAAPDHYADQYRLVEEGIPAEATAVLEAGCGVGGLLPYLERDYETVVGLDRRPGLLSFALERVEAAELVRDDAVDCDLRRSFDAVVAVEYLTAHLRGEEPRDLLRNVSAHLEPGGGFVFDAVTEPHALHEAETSASTDRYRVERTVGVESAPVGNGVEVVATHRVVDKVDGETATSTDRMPVRTFAPDELRDLLEDAGYVDVAVTTRVGEEGSTWARGYVPRE